MIDIAVTDLKKAFEVDKNILDGLTFTVDSGEHVGILGRNGAGKSTLFRLLCGEMTEDSGTLMTAPGKRVGLISQIPVYPTGYTAEDVLRTAYDRLKAIRQEMERLESAMAGGDVSEAELSRYGELSDRFEALGGYDLDVQVDKLCSGLGIDEKMRAQEFASLSGGEQTRVNLGRLILEDTDILLLDEPTNHLDLRATEWLEDYLLRFRGTVLAISHDRYFLDRVVTRIVEIVDGKAEFYSGNYSFFVEEKERRYQEKLRQYEKNQAKIAQLEQAAEKMHLWAFLGNDKLHKRAFSMEKRIERLSTAERPDRAKTLSASFGEQEFKGDELLVVKGLTKTYDGRTLFSCVDLKATGGERIGIIGDNGTGKSTFLKLLMGEVAPDSGSAKFGPAVKIAYLPQQVTFEDPGRSLVDTLIYELDCTPQTARNRLGAFLFSGDDVFKPVAALSGGERSRLKLCMLMNEDINLLILDEPTNHLDIASREWIEQAVEDYGGALLFVSHDRYFISKFATRIWELRDGSLTDFHGTFEEYRALRQPAPAQHTAAPKKEKKDRPRREKSTEKQLAETEKRIARLEQRKSELDRAMGENASDYEALMTLGAELEEITTELTTLYARWDELAEQIEA